MKSINTRIRAIRQFFTPPQKSDTGNRDERLFFVVVTAALIAMFGYALYTSPELRSPLPLSIFSGLALLHITLHWLSYYFSHTLRRIAFYLTAQGLLAFVLVLLSREVSMSIGLYAPLIGEAIGILRNARRAIIATVALLVLGVLSASLISGWGALPFWIIAGIPSILFVIIFVTLFSRQAEAREEAQNLLQELEIAHRQLAEYATQVESLTLSAERQRMARELHDTLAQGVAGLILQLEAVKHYLETGRHDRAEAIVGQAMERARGTLSDARRAIDNLRLDAAESILSDSIHQKVERFTIATGIPCALAVNLPEQTAIPSHINEHAERIIGEGLANIARYAQASQAWVNLDQADGALRLKIRDNGIGFDPEANAPAGHYGLLGMKERARLTGGSISIDSQPNKGSVIRIHLPLKEPV